MPNDRRSGLKNSGNRPYGGMNLNLKFFVQIVSMYGGGKSGTTCISASHAVDIVENYGFTNKEKNCQIIIHHYHLESI